MCLFVIAFFTMLFGLYVVPVSTTTVPIMEMTPTFTFTPETDPFADVLPAGEASPTIAPGANVPAQPTFTPPPPDFGPTMTITPTSSDFGPTMTTTPTSSGFGPTVTVTPPPFSTSSAGTLPFVQIEEVAYTENFVNDAGCDWQGIAGVVVDMRGTPVAGDFYVRITTSGEVYRVPVTNNSVFGQGGWEQKLADTPAFAQVSVQLTDVIGNPLSTSVSVTFPGTCEDNLAVVYFMQQRAF